MTRVLELDFADLGLNRATILRECWSEGKTIWERAPEHRAAQEYGAVLWRVYDAT